MSKLSQTILFKDLISLKDKSIIQSDVLVLKTSYKVPLENKVWISLLNLLTPNLVNEVKKYKRWEDQHNTLFGKLLVYLAYSILTDEKLNFDIYIRDKNNKPFLKDSSLNFNISHSEKTVVCVISRHNIKLGIDIEEIKKIDISDFENIFHQNEFRKIMQTNDVETFYKYWTRKEAFAKSTGEGISITLPLDSIDTTKDIISKDKCNYYIKSYILDTFFCSLAYSKKESKINWIEVKF